MTADAVADARNSIRPSIKLGLFSGLLLLLTACAIVRSAVTTRLDGFTIDEGYHIAAGVSYVRLGDFRINPEQPPLVKLWVGHFISWTGFRASALRLLLEIGSMEGGRRRRIGGRRRLRCARDAPVGVLQRDHRRG